MARNNKAHTAESIAKQFVFEDTIGIESAQTSFFEEKILPVGGVNNPYEFNIDALGETFIPMNNIRMYCKIRILKPNGMIIGATDLVSPIQSTISSLWKSIEVRLNGVMINQGGETGIAYKSYQELLLSSEQMEGSTIVAARGMGYEFSDDVNTFEVFGEVPCDFFRSDNYLAPHNTLSIVCTQNADSFSLLAYDEEIPYILDIMDIALYVRRIHLKADLIPRIISSTKPQRYVSNFSKLATFLIPKNMKNVRKIVSAGSVLPKQVIISQTLSSSYYGKISGDPMFFEHFNLSRLNLKINDQQIPSQPLTPNFDEGLIAREIMHLHRNCGKGYEGRNLDISRFDFLTGNALFPFDLNPDLCNGEHIHTSRYGTLEFEIDWAKPLASDIVVFAHLIYNQVVIVPPNGGSPSVEIF